MAESLFEVPLNTSTITFNCFFEPLGMKSDRNPVYGSFSTQPVQENNTLHYNNKDFISFTDIDIIRYMPRPVVGYIKNGDKVYKNAKVTFYTNYQGVSSSIIADYCTTDSAGMYKVYVKPGDYTVEVKFNNQKFIQNMTVKDGLASTFWVTTKAAIKDKEKDTISFTNSDYIDIQNYLKDNANRIIPDAEIVVFDSQNIYAYTTSDSIGKYRFSLKPGNYTVLIRSYKSHAKRVDIVFDKHSGFQQQLFNSNLFSKSNMICL